MKIQRSEKQQLFFELVQDDQIVDILFGGGAGGGKSITITDWIAIQCRDYPGIRIGLGRRELKRLKETTVFTLLHETHPRLGIKDHEFKYYDQKGTIEYINGSIVHLVDLARQPSDPDYDRFGSLNFTHTVIEEGGEIDQKARNVFISRKNRYLNTEYNIVGKSITTCNPSQNYLRLIYYNHYKKLGGGEYQKWAHGKVTINDVRTTAYRVFIKSLASDNPFVDPNYINVLRQLPDAERKRLLEGNWDFADNEFMLFKSSLIDRVTIDSLPAYSEDHIVEKYIGVDISDSGEDNTIISLLEDKILTEQEEIVVNKDNAIGEQIALAIIKFATQRGITDPKRIAIDVIGVGASTRDFLRSKGWFIKEFVAGASPDKSFHKNKYQKAIEVGFRNLRGQTIYGLSQDMDKMEIKILSTISKLSELREDLMAHEYTTEERVIIVKSKKEIKETLGRSPDRAESLYIARWASQLGNDPRNNSKRISF